MWIIYINYHHHHHHVVPLAQISLTLSRHFSLSFIASGRSSGLPPVSSHSCCMYVLAGRPAFARPYVGVHRSTSLMSSSLHLQQCLVCLVRLTWMVFWHAPNSGSVSRRWLRLKVATLNRCQLYYIIKLPELIFSIKVLK